MRKRIFLFIFNSLLILLLTVTILAGLFSYALNKTKDASRVVDTFLEEVTTGETSNTQRLLSPNFINKIHTTCNLEAALLLANTDPKTYCLNKFVKENNLDLIKIEKTKLFGVYSEIPWTNRSEYSDGVWFLGNFKFYPDPVNLRKDLKFDLVKVGDEFKIEEIIFME